MDAGPIGGLRSGPQAATLQQSLAGAPMLQIPGPPDCFLLGTCGVAEQVGPPAGLMFLALGLVALGVAILWREARAQPAEPRADADRSAPGGEPAGGP